MCTIGGLRGEKGMRKPISKETRTKVYEKYGGRCAYCGKKIEYKDMQVDHLIPLGSYTQNGTDDFENLMPACRRCNHYKRANSLESWRKMIEEIPHKLERDSYIYKVAVDYGLIEPKPHKVVFYFEEDTDDRNK